MDCGSCPISRAQLARRSAFGSVGSPRESGRYVFSRGWQGKEEENALRGKLSPGTGAGYLLPGIPGTFPTHLPHQPHLSTATRKPNICCTPSPPHTHTWASDTSGTQWLAMDWSFGGLLFITTQQTATCGIKVHHSAR